MMLYEEESKELGGARHHVTYYVYVAELKEVAQVTPPPPTVSKPLLTLINCGFTTTYCSAMVVYRFKLNTRRTGNRM